MAINVISWSIFTDLLTEGKILDQKQKLILNSKPLDKQQPDFFTFQIFKSNNCKSYFIS